MRTPKACCPSLRAGSSGAEPLCTSCVAAARRSKSGSSRSWATIRNPADHMRGTLLIARLTWLETRRRRIALAALVLGLLFVAVFATAIYFGFRFEDAAGEVNAVQRRVAATVLTVAGLYVVNFLVTAA